VPDDIAVPVRTDDASSGRPDRLALLSFVTDAETEAVLREALIEILPDGVEVRRGDIRAAKAALQKMPTPSTIIVDSAAKTNR
jgi:pilus assembly protein CpaE